MGFGDSIRRREDIRFVKGAGQYTDDLKLPGMAYAAVVRAAHAHALIRSVDGAAARALPGVITILTAEDAAGEGVAAITGAVELLRPDGEKAPETPRPLLVGERVRQVGEPVALVVAETLAIAQEAAELVQVDYEPLAAVSITEEALASGAPRIWDAAPDNIAFLWRKGDFAAVDAAFEGAAHVTRANLDISRVTAATLEPRVAIGAVEDGRLVLRTSSQSPYQARRELALLFKAEATEVRVIAGDVGGSFGMKAGLYREDPLVLWAARRLGRPVKWTSTRAEAFLADEHARDTNAATELGLDRDGHFLAFRVRCDVNIGAYLTRRSMAPVNNIGGISGVYRTPQVAAEIRGVFTNTAQTTPYRGAGRPEATYMLERTIDIAAREIGLDPFELRCRNLVAPEQMPYKTGFIFTYDSGDFQANMQAASDRIDLAGFAERRAESRRRGKLRGLGMANPIEVAAGPIRNPGKDVSRITIEADGNVMLECGIMSAGQGLETAMASIAADRLGIPLGRIRFFQGDTDRLPMGRGSGGSSALSVGGAAVFRTAERLIEAARPRAADALEVSGDDLEFLDGAFRVAGTDRAITLAELAADNPLSVEAEFKPDKVTFPNGCHICEVEVDPDTGKVELVNYVAVEDIGRVLNPLLVDGQMHGGIAQGVGQALKEAIVHDGGGEILSGTFNDYAMPLAQDLPSLNVASHEVPTAVNPLGTKGVGEAGTVGSLAATMNAVCDALAELGIRHIDMPASPARIWSAIQTAGRRD